MPSTSPLALLLAGAALVALPAAAQQPQDESRNTGRQAASQPPKQTDVEITAHVYEPELVDATAERVDGLELPDGFRLDVFAHDLGDPRIMAVSDDGAVYVTRRESADLLMLRDTNGDGTADQRQVVTARPHLHGIAIDGQTMYLVGINTVYQAQIQQDGTLTEPEPIIEDLPEAGQHPNRTLAVGPDGKLYITVGSTCNACAEPDPENATILRAEPDGSFRSVYASGLRNTIGIDWHPETGELYGFDHGIDWLGDEEQKEELNRIVQGGVYGWPYIYADGKENPADEPPAGITMEEWKKRSTEPLQLYTAHAAPMQMVFYRGDAFPQEYRGDAFATMRGSWNRKPPSGYEVVRVRFDEAGEPQGIEPFLTGFLRETGEGHQIIGRPVGLAVMPDGALLVGDDTNGVIYRVSAADPEVAVGQGGRSGGGQPQTDHDASDEVGIARAGTPVPPGHGPNRISFRLPDLAAQQDLEVSSPEIENGQPIPIKYTEYGQAFSPPLSWSAGPEGTESYVVLLEDPDAPAPTKPYIHWVAYNIPGDTTQIRGALPGKPQLKEPVSLMQGPNSNGSIGYFGMKPPPGDGPHSYHFQVFALDSMLDLPPGAPRAEVLEAMEGKVLAKGQLVGEFDREPKQ